MVTNSWSKRKTKIVCTIGPATSSVSMLSRLIKTGMDAARLNFSHGTHEEHGVTIERIRKVSRALGKQVAIIQDLPGPKFRIGKLRTEPLQLKRGTNISLVTNKESSENELEIPLRQENLPKYVTEGSEIFLADGTIKLKVMNTKLSQINCRVLVGGTILSGKGVNIPKLAANFETFTSADKDHVLFGLKKGVDLIAVSFVRTVQDIQKARKFLRENSSESADLPWIIAKIEKQSALENLDGIVKTSDAVMVARGDLGVENPIEDVPIIQKRIIRACNERAVPVITATQMLESMVNNASPTRAEVTDVANAVFDGTDAVMLSEETAIGKYPAGCVQVLNAVSLNAEASIAAEGFRAPEFDRTRLSSEVTDIASFAAIQISRDIGASLLVTPTENGRVASRLSRFRPNAPVAALTTRDETARRLKIVWGVNAFLTDKEEKSPGAASLDRLLESSIRELGRKGLVRQNDKLVIFCDGVEFLGHEGKLLFVTKAELV